MKNPWYAVLMVAVVLFGGSFIYADMAEERNNAGIEFSDHIKGATAATVKLVEYSDFECPACKDFQPILAEVMEEFGANLSLEYKHFPLPIHPQAQKAARAAEAAAQQGSFYDYHDLLFTNQATWARSQNPTNLFINYAEQLNLDVDKFKRHMNSSLIREKVLADYQTARDLGLSGTPTFYLNGERMQFLTFEEFKAQISAAIAPPIDFQLQ